MKISIALVLVSVVGCADITDYPQGPSSGNQDPVSAGPVLPGGSPMIAGRVCLLSDLRVATGCAASGAGGIAVALGSSSTLTLDNGTFSMPAPSSTADAMAFHVTGDEIVASNLAFTPSETDNLTATTIPVLTTDTYDMMLASVEYELQPGNGGIIATATQAGVGANTTVPLSNVAVASTPGPLVGPFYDGTTGINGTVSTGAAGVTWLPGMTPGPTSLTFTNLSDSSEQTIDGVQVLDGGVTIVNANF